MELLYFAVSWALVGLIWVIQLVKYPAFHFVDASRFAEYHLHHEKSITAIVLPLMVLELVLSFLLGINSNWEIYHLISLIIVLAIWLSTFLIQIPIHRILENGKDDQAIDQLVRTNWIRTFLWTLKGILFFLVF